ncbi:aspartate kinase [candidate division KSB1 bacterium]
MNIRVIKFGGTSVGSVEKLQFVSKKISSLLEKNVKIIAVVSAMGKTTDNLLDLCSSISNNPSERELGLLLSTGEVVSSALLAMALQEKGIKAAALTGAQCGINTVGGFDNAAIERIDTSGILKQFESCDVVVAAGYQGMNGDEVTVLGRGGSDATAVALSAALDLDECTIYTDVPGVLTADPRIVEGASVLQGIEYEEMIELAGSGAQVMMGRSVEIARNYGVRIIVRQSNGESPGTIINGGKAVEKIAVTGIAVDKSVVLVNLSGVEKNSRDAGRILSRIADSNINIKLLSYYPGKRSSVLSIVISKDDVPALLHLIEEFVLDGTIIEFAIDREVGQVSIVGSGIARNCGIASKVFMSLVEEGIDIQLTSTSEIKISVVVPESQSEQAARKLHTSFALDNLYETCKEVENG